MRYQTPAPPPPCWASQHLYGHWSAAQILFLDPHLSLKQPTLGHLIDETPSNIQLPQRQLVVVPVVQHVEQVRVEGVDVVHFWELIQDDAQPLVPVGLRVLDLQWP